MPLKLRNIAISTYTFIYNGIRTNNSGPVIPLFDFFKKRAKTIYLLEQPLPGSDTLDICFSVISNQDTVEVSYKRFFFLKYLTNNLDTRKTYIRLKLRDIFSNFYFLLKKYHIFRTQKIDLFIGVESINAIFGIFLKKIGIVNKVVYYIFDWAPDRYSNPIMNRVYLWLDKIATYYADYTWNITYTIEYAKIQILSYNKNKMSPQIYVPYSVEVNEKKLLPNEKINTDLVVYSGGLIEENGPDLLLKAFKLVIQQYPDAKLLIIGGGGIEQSLRQLVTENNMNDKVEFTGYIANEEEIIDLQCKAAIGVAPYPAIKRSRKPYGDVIKVRMYFACGLVVVSTPVPPVSKEIEEEKLGLKTKDDSPETIANGILLFLKNKRLLFDYRANVIAKAKKSSWERNYSNALSKMSFA